MVEFKHVPDWVLFFGGIMGIAVVYLVGFYCFYHIVDFFSPGIWLR